MTRFVSVGECMVEMTPQSNSGEYAMSFAGDTLNTAWYVRQLCPDWGVDYVTAVGRDPVSDKMVAFMSDAGIGTDHVRRIDDRTVGLYLISLDRGERHFHYWRSQAAARLLAQDGPALLKAFSGGDVIYFSGITLAILEGAGRDKLLDAVARARTRGKTIVFDTNLRLPLWENPDQMRDWVTKAAALSHIVLPSHDDEAQYFGDKDGLATRDRYAALGPATVVVKNGPGLIHYLHHGEKGVVEPAIVSDLVDTTAAGDSFNAGFLATLLAGLPVEDAINAASNVARRVIKGRGALVSI
jgi:2-dehydro-3-deoxygluconokinase